MSQSARQSQRFDAVSAEQVLIGQTSTHAREVVKIVTEDVTLSEIQSGVLFLIYRNGVKAQLPTRPRAGTTFRIRNMLANQTFVIGLSKEDSFFGGNMAETKEGTSLRCLMGEIGDEVTFVADGIDGYVVSSIIGAKWAPLQIQ